MDVYLKSIGLHRKKIAKDGSCLFRAVAEQVKFGKIKLVWLNNNNSSWNCYANNMKKRPLELETLTFMYVFVIMFAAVKRIFSRENDACLPVTFDPVQVLHCQSLHREVRAKCVDFLKQNRDSYEAVRDPQPPRLLLGFGLAECDVTATDSEGKNTVNLKNNYRLLRQL